jgi:hypothetical protein
MWVSGQEHSHILPTKLLFVAIGEAELCSLAKTVYELFTVYPVAMGS